MKKALLLAIAVLVGLACGEEPELLNETEREPEIERTPLTVEELPPMPEYPEARSGQLVTRSAGEYDIHGAWNTSAGFCVDVGTLEIYAGVAGLGNAILIRMPEGDPVGTYPLVAAQLDFPEPPAALIAVQVFHEPEAFGFQAYVGNLELTSFGETISGRFTSTLREVNIDMVLHYVGVFEELPVEELTTDYCETLPIFPLRGDSAVASDSIAGEG